MTLSDAEYQRGLVAEGYLNASLTRADKKRRKSEGDRPAEASYVEAERKAADRRERKLQWDRLRFHEASLRRKTADYYRARAHHRAQAIAIAEMLGVEPDLVDDHDNGPEAA